MSRTRRVPTTTPAPAPEVEVEVEAVTPEEMAQFEEAAYAMNDALTIDRVLRLCDDRLRTSWANTIRASDPANWRLRSTSLGVVSFKKPDNFDEFIFNIDELCILVASNDDQSIEVARVATSSYRSKIIQQNPALRSEDDAKIAADALREDSSCSASVRSALFADMANYVAPEVIEDVPMEVAAEAPEAVAVETPEAVTTPDPSEVAA